MAMRYDRINRTIDRLRKRAEAAEQKNAQLDAQLQRLQQVLDGTMHEIRRFSGELSRQCEELSKAAERQGNADIRDRSQTAMFTSGLVAARLAFSDIELNPDAIRKQHIFRAGFYKKFEKSKRTLRQFSKDRRVGIDFSGSSHTEIDAIQSFDLLPFVILDNAIKYSPEGQGVQVFFDDPQGRAGGNVAVTSIGPLLPLQEKDRIFEQSYRGSNVTGHRDHGDGLGLFLAKRLCDFHDLKINASPGQDVRFVLNGQRYAEFRIDIFWS